MAPPSVATGPPPTAAPTAAPVPAPTISACEAHPERPTSDATTATPIPDFSIFTLLEISTNERGVIRAAIRGARDAGLLRLVTKAPRFGSSTKLSTLALRGAVGRERPFAVNKSTRF